MKIKEKLKFALCVLLSLCIVFVAVFCVSKRTADCFSTDDTAMIAALSVMPNGEIVKKTNTIEDAKKPKADTNEVVTENEVQSKSVDTGEKKYKIEEINLNSGNVEYGDFVIRNSTSYPLDVKALLNEKMGFEIEDTKQVQVLIVHTHTCESYMDSDSGFYYESFYPRTTDNDKNVYAVGEQIAKRLKANGISVVHAKQQHDSPSYNGAYSRSYDTIMHYIDKYKGIKVVLDIHRDSMTQDDNTKLKPTFEYNGKKAAQIMIMTGCDESYSDFPFWEDNLKFALRLQQKCESMYPGMTRPLNFGYFTYNMNVNSGSLLIEVGTDANTLQEAMYSGEMLGNALSEVLQN